MEQQKAQPTERKSKAPATQELLYTPPQATFVPIKHEERIYSGGGNPMGFGSCNCS